MADLLNQLRRILIITAVWGADEDSIGRGFAKPAWHLEGAGNAWLLMIPS
jgi:hypothetical protein